MKPKLTSWDGDFSSLKIGLEQEHFILKNRTVPTLSEVKAVFQDLIRQGFVARSFDADNEPLSANMDFSSGYVSIKNDFCTHVIEIAFPPLSEPEEIEAIYESVWKSVKEALAKNKISIIPGAAIADELSAVNLVPHKRIEWYANRRNPEPKPTLWFKHPTTLMCATQIHMNILNESFFSKLPSLYSLEYLIPLAFSNSPKLLGEQYHCARPLIWRDNRPVDYPLWDYCDYIPTSKKEYGKLIAQTKAFERDFSFIAPRDYGSVEFRTACSQDNIQSILELIALRIGIYLYVSHFSNSSSFATREEFYKVCQNGQISKHILERDIQGLKPVTKEFSNKWLPYFQQALRKLEVHLERCC
jgi:hypothetical protein